MTYLYRCSECDVLIERTRRTAPIACPNCDARISLRRDYRAEAANLIPPRP